jgi:type IV secretory pathway VirB10-like protein
MTQPREDMPDRIDTAPSSDPAPSTETDRGAAVAAEDPERLGAEIPALGVSGGRGINKRLIVIMLGVFIIFVLGVIYALNAIMSARAGKKSTPAEEVVESPPEERKRLSPPPVAAAPAQPIPLNSERATGQPQQKPASSGPPFPSESFSAQQKGPSIQDKRGASSGPVREGALPATAASEPDRPSPGQALISKRIGRPAAAGGSGSSDSLGALLPGGSGNGDPSSKDPCEIPPGQDEESHRQLNFAHGCYGTGGQPKTKAELQLTAKFQGVQAKKLATPQSYLLARGTNIACVMDMRLVSDFKGEVSCTIPNDVFSFDGRNRLISKGSRLLGTYVGGGSADGNDRVAVTWDRLMTPHGMDIALSEPGTDSMGGSGIPGRYEGHYLQKYSNALMMSLFADVFKYAEIKYAPRIPVTQVLPNGQVLTTEQPFDSATVRNLSRIPEATLGRLLNRPGSVIVEGGQLVNTTLTRDVSFEGLAQAGSPR